MPIPISEEQLDYQEREYRTMRRSLLQDYLSASRSMSIENGQGNSQSANDPEKREEIGLTNSLTHCSEECD